MQHNADSLMYRVNIMVDKVSNKNHRIIIPYNIDCIESTYCGVDGKARKASHEVISYIDIYETFRNKKLVVGYIDKESAIEACKPLEAHTVSEYMATLESFVIAENSRINEELIAMEKINNVIANLMHGGIEDAEVDLASWEEDVKNQTSIQDAVYDSMNIDVVEHLDDQQLAKVIDVINTHILWAINSDIDVNSSEEMEEFRKKLEYAVLDALPDNLQADFVIRMDAITTIIKQINEQ